MKKAITLIFLVSALIFPIASAINLNVYTYKYHEVSVYLLKADELYLLLDGFTKESDGDGLASFTVNSPESIVDILVIVKWGNKEKVSQRFEDISIKEDVVLEVPKGSKPEKPAQSPPTNETNQTTQVEKNIEWWQNQTENKDLGTEIKEGKSIWLTGLNIFKTTDKDIASISKGKFGKVIWFILIGLIIGFGVALGAKQILKMKKQPWKRSESFFVKREEKRNDIKISTEEERSNIEEIEREIAAAEIKIKEVKMQIAKIKNRDKIKEAERKLEEDRRKLDRLKAGYEEEDNNDKNLSSKFKFKYCL